MKMTFFLLKQPPPPPAISLHHESTFGSVVNDTLKLEVYQRNSKDAIGMDDSYTHSL